MVLREEDRHFLSSLYIAIAIIFTWKGIWDGTYWLWESIYTLFLHKPLIHSAGSFISLFVGLSMLTLSGAIFKEFDPLGGIQKAASKTLHSVVIHHDKENFQIRYYDKIQKKKITIPVKWIKKIEKGALVIVPPHHRQEMFIPTHRVTEVLYKGNQYWRQ